MSTILDGLLGGHVTVADEGVVIAAQAQIINFKGSGVTAVPNATATQTDVTISGGLGITYAAARGMLKP